MSHLETQCLQDITSKQRLNRMLLRCIELHPTDLIALSMLIIFSLLKVRKHIHAFNEPTQIFLNNV